MPDCKVRVLQGLFTGDALRRIECEHLGEQIKRKWVCTLKYLRELHSWWNGQRTDVTLHLRVKALVAGQ